MRVSGWGGDGDGIPQFFFDLAVDEGFGVGKEMGMEFPSFFDLAVVLCGNRSRFPAKSPAGRGVVVQGLPLLSSCGSPVSRNRKSVRLSD